jgi:hypothetical protein
MPEGHTGSFFLCRRTDLFLKSPRRFFKIFFFLLKNLRGLVCLNPVQHNLKDKNFLNLVQNLKISPTTKAFFFLLCRRTDLFFFFFLPSEGNSENTKPKQKKDPAL